jgi:hypothetical protein
VLSARIRLIGQDVQNSPAKIAYEKWTEDTEANVPVVVTDIGRFCDKSYTCWISCDLHPFAGPLRIVKLSRRPSGV